MAQHGTFIWNELMTDDVEASKAFYAKVMGWTYQEFPYGSGVYVVAKLPGREQGVAGMMHWPADQMGARDWFAYIAVDDIVAAVTTSVEAGGTVVRSAWEVPGVGKLAIVLDAAQAAIGYMQPAPM